MSFRTKEIQLQSFFPNLDSPLRDATIAVVSNGLEFSLASYDSTPNDGDDGFESGYNIDITGNSITYESVETPSNSSSATFNDADFNGIVFTDISGTIPAIQNVTLDTSVTNFGVETSDITFTEDSIFIDFAGITYTPGEIFKLDVTFAPQPTDLVVNEVTVSTPNAIFGETIDVNWTVRNQGTQTTDSSWSDRLYLSVDNNLSADDISLGNLLARNTRLDPGETYFQTASINLPLADGLAEGNYYILVNADDSNNQSEINENNNLGTVTIDLSAPTFSLDSINTTRGSNLGEATLTLSGSQFTPDATVRLIAPDGSVIVTDEVQWVDSTEIWATFDLQGLTTGLYDVGVQQAGESATLADRFTVTDGGLGNLEVEILASSTVSTDEEGIVTVVYTNTGDTDLVAPLLQIDGDNASLKPFGEEEFTDEPIQLLAINPIGAAGILSPGATGSFSFTFNPLTEAGTDINFSVSTLTEDTAIDWNDIRDDAQPSYLSDEAWNPVWDNFIVGVDTDTDSYVATLAENATYLSQLGETTGDVERLLAFELQQASDYQSLPQRYSLGAFGLGGSFIGDLVLVTDDNGNVSLENGGLRRTFELQSNGSYAGIEGDEGILTQVNNTFRLEELDGTLTQFLVNGQLDYVEDTNSNRISASYTNTLLTGLTSSYGDSLSFAYNNQGRIISATNQAGQEVTYTYDATGELLTSVTTPGGTTEYSYDSDFNLTGITDANGTQALFTYDDQGRLITESLTDGAETITYSYDSTGGITITDAVGVETQVLLNDRGQVSQLTDALGRRLRVSYDEDGNATGIIAPDGTSTRLNYDDAGNLISQVDPLGQQISFSYEPNYDLLETVTDARGNALNYSYDDLGNLTAITYADGSTETFSYDDQGNVISSVNRRGLEIDYAYNQEAELISQTNPDGTNSSYTYDNRGNLTSATNATGTINLEYDLADRLTQITYANGRSLAYEYDAGGRRTQMTDQDGNVVNYSYDTAGRLAGLTDGAGTTIVSYTYDTLGRLEREDNGNGTNTTYSYDEVGQLLSIVNSTSTGIVNSRADYTYDELSQQTSMTTLDGVWNYSYDATGQLVGAVFDSSNGNIPSQDLSYEYDAGGNRIRTIVNGVTTDYSTNNLNQYTSAGDTVYGYDDDGNLISKTENGQTWTYSYDTENRLVGVTEPNGSTTEYEYDALGNRIATVYNGERTEYLVDPFGFGDVVAEYSGNGNPIAQYTHGIGLVSRTDGVNGTAFYDSNLVGSTVGLTGSNGSYLNRYSYRPFGEEFSETETIANPFEFVGQWGVMEEANGLDFMRARFYDEQAGRFINPDPIGLGGGDLNLYRYVGNSPNVIVDPLGTLWIYLVRGAVNVAAYALTNDDFRWQEAVGEFVSGAVGVSSRRTFKSLKNLYGSKVAGELTEALLEGNITSEDVIQVLASGIDSKRIFVTQAFTGNRAISIKAGSRVSKNVTEAFFDIVPDVKYVPKSVLDGGVSFGIKVGSEALNNQLRKLPETTLDLYDESFLKEPIYVIPTEIRQFFVVQLDEYGTQIITPITGNSEIFASASNSIISKGEPHLTTFDGVGYDFQGAGEFTLVESLDGEFEVQIRYVEIDPRATVASAVATIVDGQRVVIDSGGVEFVDGRSIVTRRTSGGTATVTIDGEVVEIPNNGELDIGNSRIYRRPGEEYTIVYAGENGILEDGDDQLVVNYMRPGTINIVNVYLGDEKKGQVQGLGGNLNDDPDDDVALPDGTPLARPLQFSELYGDYREAWRIKDPSESLFDYEPGQNPDTFYNPNFPRNHVSFNDLDPEARARGEAAALAAGYTPGTFEFESAAFDFAVTNDPGFLEGNDTDLEVVQQLNIINDQENIVTTAGNFIGAEIQLQSFFPNLDNDPLESVSAIVNDGVEFNRASFDSDPSDSGFEPGYNIDITGNSILYTAVEAPVSNPRFNDAEFNGVVFTDVGNTLPEIENVTIDSSATNFNLATSDVTFTEDTISINFEGLSYRPGDTVKLDVTFAGSADDAYEENDIQADAYDLSNFGNTWLRDIAGLGKQFDDDWYKINLDSDNQLLTVDVEFSHAEGDIDVGLYDFEEQLFITRSTSVTDNEQLSVLIPDAGEYLVQVYYYDDLDDDLEPYVDFAGSSYNLRWNSEAFVDDAYEENDELLGAYDISNQAQTWLEDISGLGISGDEDWYQIEITEGFENLVVDLQFSHAAGDLDINVYDADGNYVTGASSSTDNELIDTILPSSGTYYLQVQAYEDYTGSTYDLWWDNLSS